MNLLHMKYAVVVAKTGSINKAAEELFVAQPNLSRSIKELEADLGITIFDRSSKGMVLTTQGENFVYYAEKVLKQVDDIERMCRSGSSEKQRFSISVPSASYISDAFTNFSTLLDDTPAEIFYMETNPSRVIKNILENDYKLGIIRYAADHEHYYKEMLEEKGLSCELIAEFRYVVLLNHDNPLSQKDVLCFDDLKSLIEISHGDPYVSSMPMNVIMKEEQIYDTERVIYLFERGSQFDLLAENPRTFMCVSPIPEKLLKRYNLSQIICADNTRVYKDVLIRKKDYQLSELDEIFVTELVASKRRCLA